MTLQHIPFSCIGLKAILLTALATFQLVCFFVDAQGSSTRWPTTEFKVLDHDVIVPFDDYPIDKIRELFRETLRKRVMGGDMQNHERTADLAWERLVAGYLNDIALRYQEAGFDPPELRIVEDGGKKKYVVYLLNIDQSVWLTISQGPRGMSLGLPVVLHQLRDLTNWTDVIVIARDQVSFEEDKDRGRWRRNEVDLYSTLAHELFHSLQHSYDRRFDSLERLKKWSPTWGVSVEGMADGAAMYLVSKKFPGFLENQASDEKALGGFKYYTMFYTAEGHNAYTTRSFWFHLAERFGSLSVIEYLLRRRLPGITTAERIRWLEDGLKNHPGIKEGLYTIFPHFGTELASYGSGRYQRVPASTWLTWTVGCKTIEFTPETEVDAKYVFKLFGPIEAQCVEASWSGFPADGQLQVEAIGSDRDVLEQLHLGIASVEGNCWKFLNSLDPGKRRKQTCLLERLKVQTGPRDGVWAKTWEIAPGGYGASGRAVFVVSNVAVDPSSSWSGDTVKKSALADGTTIRFGFTRTETQGKKLAPPDAEHIRLPPYGNLRELTYGLRKTKPMQGSPPIPEIKIPVLEISGKEPDLLESSLKGNLNRRKGTREYRVLPDFTKPIVPGYTGPLNGSVTLHDPNLPMGGRGIMSGFCDPEGKRPIGQVLQADEDQMKVHVKADLCEVKMTLTPPFPKPPYPVVDHLDAVIVLPFGWRYFRDKAPVDFVTAGVQIFMDRYHERMQAHWGPQWPFISAPTGPSGPGTGTGPAPGPGAGLGAGTGSGKGSAVGGQGCDCSCESFNQLKALSKRRDAASQQKLKQMSLCAMQCMSQWTACAQSGTSP